MKHLEESSIYCAFMPSPYCGKIIFRQRNRMKTQYFCKGLPEPTFTRNAMYPSFLHLPYSYVYCRVKHFPRAWFVNNGEGLSWRAVRLAYSYRTSRLPSCGFIPRSVVEGVAPFLIQILPSVRGSGACHSLLERFAEFIGLRSGSLTVACVRSAPDLEKRLCEVEKEVEKEETGIYLHFTGVPEKRIWPRVVAEVGGVAETDEPLPLPAGRDGLVCVHKWKLLYFAEKKCPLVRWRANHDGWLFSGVVIDYWDTFKEPPSNLWLSHLWLFFGTAWVLGKTRKSQGDTQPWAALFFPS